MTFLELLQKGNIKEAYKMLQTKEGIKNHAKEYNNDRTIRTTQVGKREDKRTTDGSIQVVTKIPIPFQHQIVLTASTFLFGSAVNLVETSETSVFSEVKNLWDDLRMDSLLLQFCKTVKSETEATIVFYPKTKKSETKIKARLLTSENGKVYPVFDEFGDLIAFGWEYPRIENGKEILYLYVWTADKIYTYKKTSDWVLKESPKPNLFGKIPVVYLSQKNPEWWRVQDLIDNFEMSFSKFVDTNGYFASPMYKAKGHVGNMPKKDDTGRMVKLDIVETTNGNIVEADLDVISWDRAPEALKLEFETSKELIYALSNTPDISFDNVKGIGNVSGIALKLMFLGSILKAKDDEGAYQIVISRIVNILKSGISNITEPSLKNELNELRIRADFTSVLPENLKETIEILSEATGGKAVMSQKTAITSNPLVENHQSELELIKEENKSATMSELGNSVGV